MQIYTSLISKHVHLTWGEVHQASLLGLDRVILTNTGTAALKGGGVHARGGSGRSDRGGNPDAIPLGQNA